MRLTIYALAAIVFIFPADQAVAQGFPTGLSETAIAQFVEYDARIVAAIRESREHDVPVQELAQSFSRDFAVEPLRDVFGANWGAIREFADAALLELPTLPADKLLKGEPEHTIDMEEAEKRLTAWLSGTPDFEDVLATARFWDPRQVAVTAAYMVLPRLGSETLAHHSITAAFVSRQIGRSTWKGAEAIALLEGAWVTVLTYSRTPRGLIWITGIALYAR